MRYPVLVILGVALVYLLITQTPYGAVNYVEFRLAMDDKESVGDRECSKVIDGKRVICVTKPYFFNDSGIAEVMIFRSAVTPGRLMAGFMLNELGKKQLSVVLNKFPNHKIAIFVNDTFIAVMPPLSAEAVSDMVVIPWPGKEKDLSMIALEINKKPASILTLYIDETAKYNDVAADAWARVYENVAGMGKSKRK